MAWVRIDDHFDEHPKLAAIGPLGWGVWLAGLAYCNRNLTDGFIPRSKARMMATLDDIEDDDGRLWALSRSSGMTGDDVQAQWVIDILVRAGVWDEVPGGYQVHDYLDYQPSAEKVNAEREKARNRMNMARSRKDQPNLDRSSEEHQTNIDNGSDEVRANTDVSSHNPKPNPKPDDSYESSMGDESPKPKTKRATQVPDVFPITDAIAKWGVENGYTRQQLQAQVPLFQDHYRAKGEARKDWVASFRTWMHKARQWNQLDVDPPSEKAESPNLDYFGTDGLKRRREEYQRQHGGGAS